MTNSNSLLLDDDTSRTRMIYSDSGLGKSTQLEHCARKLAEQYGKPVWLISAEDSTRGIFASAIREGIVKAVWINKVQAPVATLRRLSAGWVPNDKGEWEPWKNEFCAVVVEGLTTIAEGIQEDNREKKRFLGEQGENSFVENIGDFKTVLALPGQFSYNFVQMEMIAAMRRFSALPGIEEVLWSAHEGASTDGATQLVREGTRVIEVGVSRIRGPATVGRKGIANIKKYCGTLLHLDFEKGERRLWFDNHSDPDVATVTYSAKLTVPLRQHPELRKLLGVDEKTNYLRPRMEAGEFAGTLWSIIQATRNLESK